MDNYFETLDAKTAYILGALILNIKLTEKNVILVNDMIKYILQVSEMRRSEIEKKRYLPDYDEQVEEDLLLEIDEENDLIASLHQTILSIVIKYKSAYIPLFTSSEIYTLIEPMLHETRSLDNQLAAVCIIADVIEHGAHPLTSLLQNIVSKFYPKVCNCAQKTDYLPLKQAAMFGIGSCAKAFGSHFIPVAPSAIKFLGNYITYYHHL